MLHCIYCSYKILYIYIYIYIYNKHTFTYPNITSALLQLPLVI